MRKHLIRLGGGVVEIFEQRLKFPTDLVRVLQGFFQLGAVFFDPSARVGEGGGNVGTVLRAEEIVYARNRLFDLRGSIIQIAKKFLSLRVQVVELRRQGVEIEVFERGKQCI